MVNKQMKMLMFELYVNGIMMYFSSLIYSCALQFSTLRFVSFACSRALFVRSEHITVDFCLFSHVNIFIVPGFVVTGILCIFVFVAPGTCEPLSWGRPVSLLLGGAQLLCSHCALLYSR